MEEKKIKWAPTPEGEFKKNFEPLVFEAILAQTKGFIFYKYFRFPIFFTLTNKRIIILKHRFFGADKFLFIGLNEIISVELNRVMMFLGLGKKYSVILLRTSNNEKINVGIVGSSLISKDIGKYIAYGLAAAFADTPAVAGVAAVAEPSQVSNKKYVEMINELIKKR